MKDSIERRHIGEIAQLERRPVNVDLSHEYHEIGIRSFGRGVFHKEPVSGAALGTKRVFRIKPGDLLLNNVFAWEGAIAVADEEQEGRIGSHRFMTYVVDRNLADPHYLLYYLLSESGLELIRRASPGSAGRNRTLGIKAFESLRSRCCRPTCSVRSRCVLTWSAPRRKSLDHASLSWRGDLPLLWPHSSHEPTSPTGRSWPTAGCGTHSVNSFRHRAATRQSIRTAHIGSPGSTVSGEGSSIVERSAASIRSIDLSRASRPTTSSSAVLGDGRAPSQSCRTIRRGIRLG